MRNENEECIQMKKKQNEMSRKKIYRMREREK